MAKIILNGITWAHSRGITPLLAYAQRFSEVNPGVEIRWKKRTLQEFADFPIEQLTAQYDLLIIDHPWVGCGAATACVLPLDRYLSTVYLDDQLQNTVGQSHLSYHYNGHQWALAIDAATPAASYRPDLLQQNNVSVPSTWQQVIELAKAGKVAVPAIPIDLLMNFYMFCMANGSEPFTNEAEVVDEATGVLALETMRELYSLIDRKLFNGNPIAVAELMAATDDFWYCPFAYCYSNYSRTGYAANLLLYTDLVHFKNAGRLRSTIGGTGIAVSAKSEHPEIAVQFAREIVSGSCQASFYVEHGGQPGHKAAWVDDNANHLTNNFFSNLLPTMQNGFLRPRYNGYLHFQDHAGSPVQQYLLGGGNPLHTLHEINELYTNSLAVTNS